MQSKEYEEWKAHIEAFNVSNVTIREYTQSKGISPCIQILETQNTR